MNSHSLLVGRQMVQSLCKTVWQTRTKVNILLLYDPAIILLGIYPKEVKIYVNRKACTQAFIAVLFIITNTWKQPRHPSVNEWIHKLWYIQTTEYYLAVKSKELSSHEKLWRKRKCIWLSERSPSEKATNCMIPTLGHAGKGRTREIVRWAVAARISGAGVWELCTLHSILLWT